MQSIEKKLILIDLVLGAIVAIGLMFHPVIIAILSIIVSAIAVALAAISVYLDEKLNGNVNE